MLRKIRLVATTLCFVLITLLFLDFTGTLHGWFGWLAKIQFLPAVLALNVGVVLFFIILTLAFGRTYCSVICPLGVFQDVIARFGRIGRKLPYAYSPALSWLRYGVLAVFVLALIAGAGSFVALLAPYSAYGRIANNLFQPLWMWGNNLLAYLAERIDSYAFYEVDVWMKSLPTLLVAVATFVVLFVLAWRNGRTYCNTICPVGTVLGFISRFSLYRITIDTEKCNSCGLCTHKCKAACIDGKQHKVDASRCVACMDCLDVCRKKAISYAPVWNTKKQNTTPTQPEDKTNLSRRRALSATALVLMGSALKAQEKKVEKVEMKRDGGLAPIKERKEQERLTPIVPPGAQSIRNMGQHCTACQLCVSACPNHVLRPSGGLMTLMQPEMSYERGYCRPECTKCSEVCPAGAILPITKADKSSIQIGHAVWVKENCIPLTDGVECGNCSRHCPTNAIEMVASDPADPKSLKIPVINTERCIGCGACENLCPSRPLTAIYVEGHERHRVI
ncbi:MAG: 4Fe-4S dicluster domain-containing protein [Parabacteroides sp.]|nr:4Fe-4S dicluster domain-containing protein [Parabacteroides sp.]